MFRSLVLTLAGVGLGLLGFAMHAAASDWCLKDFVQSCCKPCNKVCVPSIDTKKTTKKVYDSKCDAVCYPKCTHDCWFKKSCAPCGEACEEGHAPCAKCGHPYKTKVLIVKVRTCEECVVKCKAEDCCPPGCDSPGHDGAVIVAPGKPAELIGPPKSEKKE